MPEIPASPSIESWLTDIREHVSKEAPALLPMLDIFSGEARFGRRYLADDLSRLPQGAAVLEIGAGLLLLSCQLVKEGFTVTALEPVGAGFSNSSSLQAIILNFAKKSGFAPEIVPVPVEHFRSKDVFDFAFSINVMEHVDNVPTALKNICRALKAGGKYRFTCQNHFFPYEFHFGIPTLFSKQLTAYVFRKFIFENDRMDDPAGVWRSLNWITVPKVIRITRSMPDITLRFNQNFFGDTLVRATHDKDFAARRSWGVKKMARAIVALRLHKLTACLPPHIHPLMDCTLEKQPAPLRNTVSHSQKTRTDGI